MLLSKKNDQRNHESVILKDFGKRTEENEK